MNESAAALVAVGTELVADGRSDTNGDLLARVLASRGLPVGLRMMVGDDEEEIARALLFGAQRCPLIVVTGGLGPTIDDVTREAVSRAFGLPLVTDPALLEGLRARFARRDRVLSREGERQAMVFPGASVLDNPVGSAPGLLIATKRDGESRTVILLPGVPEEMEAILHESVLPRLGTIPSLVRAAASAASKRVLMKTSGLTESEVQSLIIDRVREGERKGVSLTLLASPGEISIILRAADQSVLTATAESIRAILRPWIFTEDPAESLEQVTGRALAASGRTLAVAESCTGGLLAEILTRVPGASSWFKQGWITYSNESKTALLGVDAAMIDRYGAVSKETATAMSNAARELSDADIGIGITGIAGPSGGTPEKAVGLVFIGLAHADRCEVTQHLFGGSRATVRRLAAATALHRLRASIPRDPLLP